MPSTFKKPSHVPMWRGAKIAYVFVAMCVFPVAIGGYWAYGNLVSMVLCQFWKMVLLKMLNWTQDSILGENSYYCTNVMVDSDIAIQIF